MPGHCPASVATSFQLGSRDEMSRAKVHTSVTSVTFSGEPSMTRQRHLYSKIHTEVGATAAIERHDGHQHGRIHLRVDELLRGRVGAHLIVGRHGGGVEIEDHEPAIPVLDGAVGAC